MKSLFYLHSTYTYCSSANKLKINPVNAYEKLLKEFEQGHVTYPRTDLHSHFPILILDGQNINKEVKNILKEFPVLKKTPEYIAGDVYSLAGELFLTSPGSLVYDVEKAKKIKDEIKKVDIYIGLKKKEFLLNSELFIETKNTNMNLLKKVFKEREREVEHIPAFNKEKYVNGEIRIA